MASIRLDAFSRETQTHRSAHLQIVNYQLHPTRRKGGFLFVLCGMLFLSRDGGFLQFAIDSLRQAPVGQLSVQYLALQPASLPGRIVCVLDFKFAQRRWLSLLIRSIQAHNFTPPTTRHWRYGASSAAECGPPARAAAGERATWALYQDQRA
jgi:hypothetical protein